METDSGATSLTTDIIALRLDRNGQVEPLIQGNAGERNAEIKPAGSQTSSFILVQNWFEELKRLVPR